MVSTGSLEMRQDFVRAVALIAALYAMLMATTVLTLLN